MSTLIRKQIFFFVREINFFGSSYTIISFTMKII